jgi:hypothetical protein
LIIELNDAEQRLAKYLAQCRYKSNRASGTINRKIGDQSDEETDLNGIGAEIAFCKLFNVFPDTNIDQRPNEDAILHSGIRVDVKTTKYPNGKLITPIWKKKISVELYALMIGTFPAYKFAGCIRGDELFKDENIINLGYGDTYAVFQDKLIKY